MLMQQDLTLTWARWTNPCFEAVGPIQANSFQILLFQQATGFNPIDHCQCFRITLTEVINADIIFLVICNKYM